MPKKRKRQRKPVGFHNVDQQSVPSKSNNTLQALTSAALVLPGLLLTSTASATANLGLNYLDSFNVQVNRFQEGKRNLITVPNNLDPVQADVLQATGALSLTDRLSFTFAYTRDVWSGATPVTTSPLAATGNNPTLRNTEDGGTVVSGASPFVVRPPIGSRALRLDRDLNFLGADGEVDNRSVEVLSFASPEVRNAGDFSLGYEWDDAAIRFGGGLSSERDFKSAYGTVSGRLDFNQKLTSAKFGFGYTDNETNAVIDTDIDVYLTRSAFDDQITFSEGLRTLRGRRQDFSANIGLTQVLSKSSLVDVNVGYTHSTGFMENPYKAFTFIFVDPEDLNSNQDTIFGDVRAFIEQRPDKRNQVAISTKLIQHISPLDAALHFDYRFTTDDWGINTNTFTADWIQPLGNGWTVTPRIRYHSQDRADFYQPFLFTEQRFSSDVVDDFGRQVFESTTDPDTLFTRDENLNLLDSNGNQVDELTVSVQPKTVPFDSEKLPDNFSSDHRLSGYGTLSGGVTLNKQITKGLALRAGFEYFTRQSALQIGGDSGGSFGDFDFYVANAGLSINIEKFNFPNLGGGGSGGSGHSEYGDKHQHYSHVQVPAGVMAGMMLGKAGEYMVGYRFMHGRMGGGLLDGANSANDLDVVNEGCEDELCRFAPDFMNMNMHMINVMYAPTDWLNLMVMPKFVDNQMNLRRLEGAPAPTPDVHEHRGVSHITGGIGDTTLASLIKLYEAPGHRLHMGLGVSVPTGSVSERFRRMVRIDGGLVHFGMQLGSGTWDFLPSLTYTGDHNRMSWGAQLSGTKRLEDQNKSGYRLGDVFEATTWGGYNLTHWLSTTVRGVYRVQGRVSGDYNDFNRRTGPMDFAGNQGGQFWDIGFGINAAVPSGKFVGHQLSVEWLEPIRTDVNGFQLDRQGRVAATWNYHF